MKLGIRVFVLLLVIIIVLAGCGEVPVTSAGTDVMAYLKNEELPPIFMKYAEFCERTVFHRELSKD